MGKILGEQFRNYVVKQINERQKAHGAGAEAGTSRTIDQLTYLNSNSSWIKLASGVSVLPERIAEENLKNGMSWSTLAKQHVLFSGTSILQDNDDYSGILKPRGTSTYEVDENNLWGSFFGTYSVNASNNPQSEFGLVPMPGITDAEIKCLNRGSIKKATVNIKCYSPEQFQIIDLLYLRLGYTVFLEWGNSLYLDDDKIIRQNFTLIEAKEYGFFSDRWKDSSYSGFLPMIEAYRGNRKGNYDGLLAKVVNFSWTFSQDGSYDITLELISLGDVIESLKLNITPSRNLSQFIKTAYTLYSADEVSEPDKDLTASPANNAISAYLFLQKIYIDQDINPEGSNGKQRITNRQVTIRDGGTPLSLGGTFVVPPLNGVINLGDVYSESPVLDNPEAVRDYMSTNYPGYTEVGSGFFNSALLGPGSEVTNMGILTAATENSYVILDNWNNLDSYAAIKTVSDPLKIDPKLATKGDVVYMNYNEGQDDEEAPINDAGFYMRWGHLLQYINDKVLPVISNDTGTKTKILKINFDTWGNKMYTLPYQVSFDPRVCIVKSAENIKDKEYFPELDSFKNTTLGYAWPMNIYLNHNQILSSLNENMDEKGNIAIFDFINSLCIAVNKAMGGINNLEPFIDEDTNTLYIVDASYQPVLEPSPYILELYGYNKAQSGFVRNFNLKTEITNDFATMATVGSTAGGYVKGTENTMFSKWNKGLVDRWKEKFEPADIDSTTTTGSVDEPLQIYVEEFWNKSYSAFGYTLMDIEYDVTLGDMASMNDEIIDSNIAVVTEFYKYLQTKIQSYQESISSSYSSPTNGFIPISLGITMDGISGIKIYNEVNVDTKFLPRNYPDNLRFIIKGVNHKLSNSDWETNLETVVISRENKDPKSRLGYDKIKTIVDDLLLTAGTATGANSLFNQIFGGTGAPSSTTTGAVYNAIFGGNVSPITSKQKADNIRRIASYLKSIGFTKEGTIGLIGNILGESQANPSAIEKKQQPILGGTGGIGIVQWTASRRRKLEKEANNDPNKILDLNFQLKYLGKELQNSYSKVFKKLSTTTSISEATIYALEKFEVPGTYLNRALNPGAYEATKAKRIGYANSIKYIVDEVYK